MTSSASGGLEEPDYPPDRYKSPWAARKFAINKLGVREVDYGRNVRIANICNRAVLALSRRGVAVPYALLVDATKFEGEEAKNWLACYELLVASPDAPGRILINPAFPEWADDQAMQVRRDEGQFSTGSRYHPIVHELAELAYHQAIGTERFTPPGGPSQGKAPPYQVDEQAFLYAIQKKPEEIAEAVSSYAMRNHVEFVCEVFTAISLGRRELLDNKRVMTLYDDLQGPRSF